MIALDVVAEGIVLPVKVQPGARRNAVVGEHAGAVRVAVTAAPERGKANAAVIEVLIAALGLRRGQIELIAGETSPRKRFLIRAIGLEDLRARIEAAPED